MFLNQVIAQELGIKSQGTAALTKLHRSLEVASLVNGLTKTYTPLAEEGVQYPGESTPVQIKALSALAEVATVQSRMWNIEATKDTGNREAVADLIVDGELLIPDAPVSWLIYMEKQLDDVHTVVAKLITLDPAERWTWDANEEQWVAASPKRTMKTAKTPRNHVKAEATIQHPAQVEMYYEDVPVGTWTTTQFSGAVSAAQKRQLIGRVETLQRAIKVARAAANMTEVELVDVGTPLFAYLLEGLTEA